MISLRLNFAARWKCLDTLKTTGYIRSCLIHKPKGNGEVKRTVNQPMG